MNSRDIFQSLNLSFNWLSLLIVLRLIGTIVSIILFCGIIYLSYKLIKATKVVDHFKVMLSPSKLNSQSIERFINHIKKRLGEDNPWLWKLALVETENYFDKTLEEMRIKGKTLEEKLTHINSKFLPNVNTIKEAHLIIKEILDIDNYPLEKNEVEYIINIFLQGLKYLQNL